jgi:hypothetical protein
MSSKATRPNRPRKMLYAIVTASPPWKLYRIETSRNLPARVPRGQEIIADQKKTRLSLRNLSRRKGALVLLLLKAWINQTLYRRIDAIVNVAFQDADRHYRWQRGLVLA